MSLEVFQEKMRVFSDVMTTYEAFRDALAKVHSQWQKELPAEIAQNLNQCNQPPKPDGTASNGVGSQENNKPWPAKAIRALLRRNPQGMRFCEIAKDLHGKVRTRSKNDKIALQNAVHALAKNNEVLTGSDGLIRLAE